MTTKGRKEPILAADGLRARESGAWAEVKLAFLDHFCPPAIQATARKRQRYYVDLFAGPGINVPRAGGTEFEGSPLRVLRYRGRPREDLSFTHAAFVNADPRDHEALTTRVERLVEAGQSRIPRENIQFIPGDANNKVAELFQQIPMQAYAFVFADMEKPKQWPWESMRRLRAFGHTSVDLYMLLPLDMALMRLFSYAENRRKPYARVLTAFLGTEAWRDLVKRRPTTAQSKQLQKEIVELYLEQLRTLWREAGEMVDVYLRGRQRLYKMLFASDHPAGKRIAEWVRDHKRADAQTDIFA